MQRLLKHPGAEPQNFPNGPCIYGYKWPGDNFYKDSNNSSNSCKKLATRSGKKRVQLAGNSCISPARSHTCGQDEVCDATGKNVGPDDPVEKVGGPYVDLGGIGSLCQVLFDKAATDASRKGKQLDKNKLQAYKSNPMSPAGCLDDTHRPVPLCRWKQKATCVKLGNRCGGGVYDKKDTRSPSTPPDYLYSGGKPYASPRYMSSRGPVKLSNNEVAVDSIGGISQAPFFGTGDVGLPYDAAGRQANEQLTGYCDNKFIYNTENPSSPTSTLARWKYWKNRGRIFPSQYVSATSKDILPTVEDGKTQHAWGIPHGCFGCGAIDINSGLGYKAAIDSLATGIDIGDGPASTRITRGVCTTGGFGSNAFKDIDPESKQIHRG